MNSSQRSSQYVSKPGSKYSTPATFNERGESSQKKNYGGKISSQKMSSSTNYKSGRTTAKTSAAKLFEERKYQTGAERTESYQKDLDEFPSNNTVQKNRETNRNTYISQLRSIKTKSSKFDDVQSEEVEDLMMKNGFHQSKGEFSAKNSSHQDCYFKNMNEFVDDKLEMVVEKLAEKKSLNTVNNTLRCAVDKLAGETGKLLKENKSLETEYEKHFEVNKKLNTECDELLDQLTVFRENLEGYRISENANINSMREEEAELRNTYNHDIQQFNLEKNLWNDDLKEQREEIRELEEENRLAQISLKDAHAKHKYCKKLEIEKAMVFKEKSKILDQLIKDEKPTLKATTNKRVMDITKNFAKKLDNRKITQGIDTTRGIIDLSSTKLFNNTLNSIRIQGVEKTFDSIEKMKTNKSMKRSSMGKMNISHNSVNMYK